MKYEKDSATTIAYGITLVYYLLENCPERGKVLYLHPDLNAGKKEELLNLGRQKGLQLVADSKKAFSLSKDSTYAAVTFDKRYSPLIGNLPHVVLHEVSNMGNLGTIMRCMAAFGIHDLALVGVTADPYDPKTVRASMGGIFRLRIARFANIGEYRKSHPEHNLYPFMLRGASPLESVVSKAPYALLFGNEARGLPDDFAGLGTPVKIEQNSDVDSLNLDNAVSIGLYSFLHKKAS